MKPSIAIIGAGKVGTALGFSLKQCGYSITAIISRTEQSAKKCREIIKEGIASTFINNIPETTDVIFVCTNDSSIPIVAEEIVRNFPCTEKHFLGHTSGVLTSEVFSLAEKKGAHTFSLHPMQTFSNLELSPNIISKIYFGFEGNDNARTVIEKIVSDLDSNIISISKTDKISYHLSGVFASNYLVTVIDIARRLLEKIGVSEEEGYKVIKSIVATTIENIEKKGTVYSLTGPIVRGDKLTIEKHFHELSLKEKNFPSNWKVLYAMLGFEALRIAMEKEELSDEKVRELLKVFSENLVK
jgi:predicted short-subunit dehydrogenase-like oxidoreductase (DUF2520 family)